MFFILILNFFNNLNGYFFMMESFSKFYIFLLSYMTYLFILLISENYISKLMTFFLFIISFFYFFSWNLIYFFIFFELSMIPIIMISMFLGMQIEKMSSMYYLIFYSFLTGFPFLFFIMFFNFKMKMNLIYLNFKTSILINFMFFIMFLMKFPIYFLHNWLPKMHVESSMIGSMLLAGLLLKFGTMGFSFLIKMLNFSFMYFFLFLSIMSLFLSLMINLIQNDLKSYIAFSSMIHMSIIFLLYLMNSNLSMHFNLIMMIGHGFISPMMFMLISLIFHKLNNRILFNQFSIFMSSIITFLISLVSSMMNCSSPLSLSSLTEFSFFWFTLFFLNFFDLMIILNFLLDFYSMIFLLMNLIIMKKIKDIFNFIQLFIFYFFMINLNFFIFNIS